MKIDEGIMRQLLTLLLTAMLLGTGFLQAQSILIAPGISFRNEERLALQQEEGFEGLYFRVAYQFPKWLSIGPEFSYYKPLVYEGDADGDAIVEISRRRIWALDINAHIDLHVKDIVTFYPIIGLNVTNEYLIEDAVVVDGSPIIDPTKEGNFGVNVGVGFHLFPKQLGPFAEYRYNFGGLSAHTLSAGLVIRLNLGAKDTDWVDDHEDIRLK